MAGYDLTVLNTIRASASTRYQDRVPQATRDNIAAVGNAILNYTPDFNEFTGLLGKIGMTMVASKMATNRLAVFKKGMLSFGTTIEEFFVKMARSEGKFDKNGSNPLGRRNSEILAMYHKENRQEKYVVSISKAQVKSAFMSEEGVTALLNEIVNSIYSGSEYDEFILMKELLAQYEANYFNYEVSPITDEATAKEFMKTVRKAVNDISFMTDKYNKAAVHTHTAPGESVLLINKDVLAEVDVEVLSKSFNIGKVDFQPEVIVMDDFGSMTNTYALLVDKDFFMVMDTLRETAQQENADGLFTNIFLHIWQVLSLSQFRNAIRFTDADVVTV